MMESFEYFNDFKSKEFKKIFKEYYLGEGITLTEHTKVFDEIENSSKRLGTKCIVYKKANNIAGFILFRLVKLRDEKKFFKYNFGYIEELYVIESERNKNVATKLMEQFENYLKQNKIKTIILTAEEKVYDFYVKKGFEEDNSIFCENKLKCFIKKYKSE